MLYCCGAANPVFCDRADPGAGCYLVDTDCTTITFCKDAWHGCKRNEEFHCGTKMPPTCCGLGNHAFCDELPDQGGGCYKDGADCSTLRQCGGEWKACLVEEQPNCGTKGAFACCNRDRPQFCDGDPGIATCWQAEVNCASIRECGGGLIACNGTDVTNCCPGGVGGCCPEDTPCADLAAKSCKSPMDPTCSICTR